MCKSFLLRLTWNFFEHFVKKIINKIWKPLKFNLQGENTVYKIFPTIINLKIIKIKTNNFISLVNILHKNYVICYLFNKELEILRTQILTIHFTKVRRINLS